MADQPPETIEVETATVECDGGGALGHPLVYLNLGREGRVECPYCDRLFVLKPGAGRGGGH
ncbi:MAG: zinc-finger domain-containing protein [Pseudomonadota bacterium]